MLTTDQKLKAMLWDLPQEQKDKLSGDLIARPLEVLSNNETLLLKALNTLSWFELIDLTGAEKLVKLLSDDTIKKLFPGSRREYYTNARRLLSKYSLSTAG
jgi:hypothetical protein